jgi:hypothetical protein
MLVIFSLLHIFFSLGHIKITDQSSPFPTVSVSLQLVKTHWITLTFIQCTYQICSETFFFFCNPN